MTRVFAHRGARSIAPENTMAAVEKAYETGADLWETDVNVTGDGRLVLFHDENLLRCTNARALFPSRHPWRLRDFSLDEILTLDAGSYFADTDPFAQILHGAVDPETAASFKDEKIPTLEQGLVFTKEHKWKVNLELKDYGSAAADQVIVDKTLDMIHHTGIDLNQVVISSFNHDWLKRVMEKEPGIEVQALIGYTDTDPLDFGDWRFSTYNANALLIDPDQIKSLKARGKKINLFTINDPGEFEKFAGLGVDGIFTDFPQVFASKL